MYPKFLEENVSRGCHEYPQLVSEETGTTGAIDLKAVLEFLDPVLNITANRASFRMNLGSHRMRSLG